MKRSYLVAALIAVFTLNSSLQADLIVNHTLSGVVLFDNLSDATSGNTGVSNTQWTAQAFSTTATDFVLDEVSLRLWDLTGSTTGNFQIQVWDAAGASGSPGAQVGSAIYTGLAENLADSSSLLTISGLNVALGASTNYNLLVRGTTLSSDDFLTWDVTSVVTLNAYSTGNSGTSWIGPRSNNFKMKVTAVPASAPIPEPGTWAAMAIFAGGAAYAGWRRRRQHTL